MQILRILPPDFMQPLTLCWYYIAITEKKHTNTIVKYLRQAIINPSEQNFLKRVNKVKDDEKVVKIVLCYKNDEKAKEDILDSAIGKLIDKVIEEQLPKNAPKSKQDYYKWSQYWPINYLEPEEVKLIKHSAQEQQLLQFLHTSNQNYLLFDEHRLLMQHQTKQQCKQGTINHPIMQLLTRWPQSKEFQGQNKDKYYYLTGLRLYLREAVCEMCSMALVHSRLERLYIPKEMGEEQGQKKQLDKMMSIMQNRKLNHRIELFSLS